jgi:hypothetical protein
VPEGAARACLKEQPERALKRSSPSVPSGPRSTHLRLPSMYRAHTARAGGRAQIRTDGPGYRLASRGRRRRVRAKARGRSTRPDDQSPYRALSVTFVEKAPFRPFPVAGASHRAPCATQFAAGKAERASFRPSPCVSSRPPLLRARPHKPHRLGPRRRAGTGPELPSESPSSCLSAERVIPGLGPTGRLRVHVRSGPPVAARAGAAAMRPADPAAAAGVMATGDSAWQG